MKEDLKACIAWLWASHRGVFVGATTGLVIGILFLLFGFFRTLFLLALVTAGVWFGHAFDTGHLPWVSQLKNLWDGQRNDARRSDRFDRF